MDFEQRCGPRNWSLIYPPDPGFGIWNNFSRVPDQICIKLKLVLIQFVIMCCDPRYQIHRASEMKIPDSINDLDIFACIFGT
jgi:hypothetical protein